MTGLFASHYDILLIQLEPACKYYFLKSGKIGSSISRDVIGNLGQVGLIRFLIPMKEIYSLITGFYKKLGLALKYTVFTHNCIMYFLVIYSYYNLNVTLFDLWLKCLS